MAEAGETARLEALIVELQTQLAFQEQTISELSEALARQQADLEALRKQWDWVQERYASLQEQLPAADAAQEKPPHY